MEKRPLDYAKASMDTMMRKWEAPKLPPEGRFHYHQGVFLSGMYKSYELCKEENILITSSPGWMPSSPKTV